jgi:hypothetical protein
MMLIGRSSRRENLLWVTGVEPKSLIRTHLANHIRASSREEWLHQQARHMTAPDRNRHHANSAFDAGAPSTHDPAVEPKLTALDDDASDIVGMRIFFFAGVL